MRLSIYHVGMLTLSVLCFYFIGKNNNKKEAHNEPLQTSPNDFQGRSAEQLAGGYKIMTICFVAIVVLLVIALIIK